MIDAKLKGEGIDLEAETPAKSNVIDLMAALKKSLGQTSASELPPKPSITKKTKGKEPVHNQPGLKLPIKGGKTAGNAGEKAAPEPAAVPAKPSRKRA